ncbi:MAG: hypothetical protein NTZ17_21865 [Phycisphaerae bacterium]|nr:hypothetical protein [Phycisphaerae bacterium]
MKRFRISGLVGLAKRVRQELAGPVSPERLAQIRWDVQDTIRTIEQTLRDKGVRAQDLPAPSRKAHQFLKSLDLDAVVTQEMSSASSFPPESVSFRGLHGHFDSLLDRLARATQSSWRGRPALGKQGQPCPERSRRDGLPTQGLEGDPKRDTSRLGTQALATQLEEVYHQIKSDSESIEHEVRAQHVRPEQLKKQAREMRGWLAYFSQRENFDAYCAAVRRAEPAFRAASLWSTRRTFDILVHFRPLRGMYHIVGYSDWALVQLPTPAICFDEEILRSAARIAFKKGGDRQLVHEAAAGESYRRIASVLEQLGGVVTQARGLHHDLDASFDRVNAEYFDGAMSRPHLVWSRTFATRKFGHYDHAHDTIMVNMVLDRASIPEFAVDFIVYHELLHKHLGVTWKNNRIAAHTPELAERERQFQHYDQAKIVLRKLASER